MAVWVNFSNVRRFAEAMDVVGDAGFRTRCRNEANGSAVWARYAAGTTRGDLDIQVDVLAIPGVRPLDKDGHIHL